MKIGIMGLAGAGKDTFAEYLLRYMQGYMQGYRIEKFAAPLKNAAYQLFGAKFDDRDVKEVDQLKHPHTIDIAAGLCWSELGISTNSAAWARQHAAFPSEGDDSDGDFPISISPRRFQQLLGTEVCRAIDPDCFVKRIDAMRQVIVTDCRFQNEMDAMDEILLVVRPGIAPVANHESERLAAELTQAYLDCGEMHFMFMGKRIRVVDNSGTLADLELEAEFISRSMLDKH